MTRPASKPALAAGILLIGGLSGLVLDSRAGAEPAATQAASPRFVYASGFQGVGYYANTGARTAPAARTSANRGSSVGPGVRDWSTGRRGRLHKPWLQPR